MVNRAESESGCPGSVTFEPGLRYAAIVSFFPPKTQAATRCESALNAARFSSTGLGSPKLRAAVLLFPMIWARVVRFCNITSR